jgi:hypothetical protein
MMAQHPRQMSRAMRLLAGLVLFGVPLAAQQQPQQPARGFNRGLNQVPAPRGGRFNQLVEPPQQNSPPSITIAFDRNPVRVGEDSVVKLEPANVVLGSPFVLTVNFGDGASTVVPPGRADVAHVYQAAGSYAVLVAVSQPGIDAVGVPAPVVSNNNASISVLEVELGVSPAKPITDEPVSFSTQFQSNDSNIRYRFTFGDGTSSDWLTTPETQHAFGRPGDFPNSYVEVGRASARVLGDVSPVTQSAPVLIQVAAAQVPVPRPGPGPAPTPVPVPVPTPQDGGTSIWPYAAVILAALAILGYSAKQWLSPPRIKLEPHEDPEASSKVADGPALAIDVEIRLHRVVAAGEIRGGAGDAGLVTGVRRTHG